MSVRAFGWCGAGARRWGIVPLVVALAVALVACGKDSGETGVKVIITPAPPTPTNLARSLTPAPTLPPQTAVAFPSGAPTITNALGSQLVAGAKARVKDSADGLTLRESPSTKAKPVTSLAAGAELSILSDPQEAEGRTWVKIAFGNFQGFVAADFIERIK